MCVCVRARACVDCLVDCSVDLNYVLIDPMAVQTSSSVDEVVAWLSTLGLWETDLETYIKEVDANHVDGQFLFAHGVRVSVEKIGVTIVGHKVCVCAQYVCVQQRKGRRRI